MFTYQENTHFSQALPCGREEFWREVRKPNTAWRIDARRAILEAVGTQRGQSPCSPQASHTGDSPRCVPDRGAIERWMNNADYQKFLLKKQGLKKEAAKKAWEAKTDAEKLLAFAQEIKDNSTAFIYSCYKFDETKTEKGKPFCHRRLADCHLNGLVMLDIDHVENPMQIWWKLREEKTLMERVALVHITSSGKGIRIVFTADINDGNLADNQIVFAQALGYKADESCIDATRNSFAPKEEDILYLNETLLFDYYNEEFDKRYTQLYREKKTQPLYHEFPSKTEGGEHCDDTQGTGTTVLRKLRTDGSQSPCVAESQGVAEPQGVAQAACNVLKWRGYDIQSIIDARYGDKLPCRDDSNRHTESLKLATDLLIMLDGDKAAVQRIVEAQPWVQEIIAERDENVEQTVESAADCVEQKEKKTPRPYPSKAMQEAVEKLAGKSYKDIIGNVFQENGQPSDIMMSRMEQWGVEIEAMFPDFPLLQDVCANLKRSQYPAALFVASGLLMTLMTRCWYRFYHRPQQERRLNCSLLVIGHPASNKSMADDLYKILASPMISADKAGKQALNRYKEETKKKAANKEGKEKPKGIIRVHPARTANGQFITDMLNAHENINGKDIQLHMFSFDTELDNTIRLMKSGSWIDKTTMELKAFHNEEDGQMYMNADSPVDNFYVTWNFIYTGTPLALKKKVNEQNFGSGLSTRLAAIPMPKTNFEMMEFEEYQHLDFARMDRMKTWAFKLDTRYGELPFWELVKKLYNWTKNRMEDCKEDQSEANELMLKRVPYHALNYAAPFIDMRHWDSLHQEGRYWTGEYETDETDWKLCELIARIQYATQQYFFGVLAEKYFDDMNSDVQISGKRHQQRSVDGYNRLPDVFTKEDVVRCFNYKNLDGVYVKLSRLINCQLAEQITEGEHCGKYRKINQSFI